MYVVQCFDGVHDDKFDIDRICNKLRLRPRSRRSREKRRWRRRNVFTRKSCKGTVRKSAAPRCLETEILSRRWLMDLRRSVLSCTEMEQSFNKSSRETQNGAHPGLPLFISEGRDACRMPASCKKSHTLLVLLTSILIKSRASLRRKFPPRRANSRTSVSLITR